MKKELKKYLVFGTMKFAESQYGKYFLSFVYYTYLFPRCEFFSPSAFMAKSPAQPQSSVLSLLLLLNDGVREQKVKIFRHVIRTFFLLPSKQKHGEIFKDDAFNDYVIGLYTYTTRVPGPRERTHSGVTQSELKNFFFFGSQ